MGSFTSSSERQTNIKEVDQQDDGFKESYTTRPSAYWQIGLSALGLIAPMLLLTAALITFILLYKVDKSTLMPMNPAKIEHNAIYVHADSTLLVFVSSWMSSLVAFLTAFAITLATYPIAQQLLQDSTDGKLDRLLTSFQLSIVIMFMNGSIWNSLWNLLRYNTSWNKRALRHGAALISITLVTTAVIFLG